MTTRDEIVAAIDALQVWFAGRYYGWRETATAEELKAWDDRVRREDELVGRLAVLGG